MTKPQVPPWLLKNCPHPLRSKKMPDLRWEPLFGEPQEGLLGTRGHGVIRPPPPGGQSLTENTTGPSPLKGNVPVLPAVTEAMTTTPDLFVTFVIDEATSLTTVPGFLGTVRGPIVACAAGEATASGTALRGPRLDPAPSARSLDTFRKTVLMPS